MKQLSTVLLVAALALSVVAAWLLWRTTDQMGGDQMGGVRERSAAVPFALTDQDGRVRTDKDFRGHWVLLYFGYSYCPDVCPTTLAMMASALEQLGAAGDKVVPVFVSVDPERDTPAVLKTYLASFGPHFVGLTGQPGAIAKIARAYGVYYQKHPLQGGNYSVDHTSAIYLLDPEGRFVKSLDAGAGAKALAADLKQVL